MKSSHVIRVFSFLSNFWLGKPNFIQIKLEGGLLRIDLGKFRRRSVVSVLIKNTNNSVHPEEYSLRVCGNVALLRLTMLLLRVAWFLPCCLLFGRTWPVLWVLMLYTAVLSNKSMTDNAKIRISLPFHPNNCGEWYTDSAQTYVVYWLIFWTTYLHINISVNILMYIIIPVF